MRYFQQKSAGADQGKRIALEGGNLKEIAVGNDTVDFVFPYSADSGIVGKYMGFVDQFCKEIRNQ